MTDSAATAQAQHRVSGAQAALAAAGQPPPELMVSPQEMGAGYAVARDRLTGPDRPTGLICAHERLALGAVLAAASSNPVRPGWRRRRLGRATSHRASAGLGDGERLASVLVPASVGHGASASWTESTAESLDRTAAARAPDLDRASAVTRQRLDSVG